MTQPTVASVGDRIAVARRRRGMSRRALADIIGRSEEWLRQVENGQRRLDSIEYATRLGKALRVGNLMSFLGIEHPVAVPSVTETEVIAPVKEALMDSVQIQAFVPTALWDEAARTVDEDVDEARARWIGGTGRYGRTIRLLPRLLRGAAARLHTSSGAPPAIPAIASYHLARTVLSRTGEEQLAWLAADRALTATERTDGSSTLAAAWHVSACYLAQDAFSEAFRFAMSAVERHTDRDNGEGDVLIGALRLIAAEAAAAMLEAPLAYRMLDLARGTAEEVGDTVDPHIVPFGPTEVSMCAVRVASRLGQPGEALRLASRIEVPEDHTPDRQARHYIQLALLHSRRNEDPSAVFALTQVAAVSPEDIRYDWQSQEVLNRLVRRNNPMVRRELSRLVQIAGIV